MGKGTAATVGGLAAALAILLLAIAPAGAHPHRGHHHHKKKPDLVETSVVAPAVIHTSSSVDVTDTVTNKGRKKARKSATAYYLSRDLKWTSDDEQLRGTRLVPKLGRHKSSTGTATVLVPAATQLGDYYVIACANYGYSPRATRRWSARTAPRTSKRSRKALAGPVGFRGSVLSLPAVGRQSQDGAARFNEQSVRNNCTASGPVSVELKQFPG